MKEVVQVIAIWACIVTGVIASGCVGHKVGDFSPDQIRWIDRHFK